MAGSLTLEHIITFLLGAPMFGDLDAIELSQIVHIMQIQHVRPGQLIFREGQPGDAWYVVYSGELEVFAGAVKGAEDRILASLGPSACFGEMAILDGSPRSASVRARAASTVFRFPHDDFQTLLRLDNLAAYKLVYHMAKVLVSRQRNTTAQLAALLKENQDRLVQEGLSPIVERSSLSE
jgi:CRP-like cAMP-binding protein